MSQKKTRQVKQQEWLSTCIYIKKRTQAQEFIEQKLRERNDSSTKKNRD